MDPGRNTERRRVITEALEVVLPSVRSTGNFLLWEVFTGSRTKEHSEKTGTLSPRGRQKQPLWLRRRKSRLELANRPLDPPGPTFSPSAAVFPASSSPQSRRLFLTR